jgi:iron complex outermembrane receptor protein
LIATGNKSGGFNDNIPGTEGFATNPAQNAPVAFNTDTLAPTYGPEQLTLFELGSKNEFDLGDYPAKFNVSAFYYDYDDLQLTTLLSTAQILDREGQQLSDEQLEGLGGNIVGFTFNASDAEIFGAQFEGGIELPSDINLNATLLWLEEAKVVNSQEIQDARFQADVDPENAVNRSIEGNRLIRTPKIQFNGSISKFHQLDSGSLDGVLSVGYRSSQFMTIFNGIDYNNSANPDLRLNDKVEGYWTLDAGAGYSHGDDGKWRIEAYISNITNQQKEQAIIITQFDNTRFFSRPRTYGARLRVRL